MLFILPAILCGDALLSTRDNLLENKVSNTFTFCLGHQFPIWKNSHLHAELACICHNHRISGRLLARITHFHCEAWLWEGGSANTVPQAVIGSTNCESQSHLTSCENFSHLRSCESQSWYELQRQELQEYPEEMQTS